MESNLSLNHDYDPNSTQLSLKSNSLRICLSALEWQVLSENLPLALMLRYMLRSQAPIVLTDRFTLLLLTFLRNNN